jgi:proton-translocating NADH-quinone oxidoreductase chain L
MSDLPAYLWLVPAFPLAAAIVTACLAFAPVAVKRYAHWPCILGALGACVVSFFVFGTIYQSPESEPVVSTYYTWFHAGTVDVTFTLRADTLTAFMLVTVTFIGSLIAVYAVGYMHGDPGCPRFFAEVALFIFSMTGLVLADNFFVLYAFWEGVGLCSYLLIGFWFTKPSAADAARKAFLTTRLGDIGFFIGIVMLWLLFGNHLNYDAVFGGAAGADPNLLLITCLLLFCGAVGKSAQFPLHVWLPDAMEGPTPVSALIHAATMVTAGVYLVARCTPLFSQAPDAQLVVACIGGFTALLAALIALTQHDLKRVLAYSTISQLGYMFLGVGSGAVTAGMFHLFTHAFFKALLFLSAGSVMHAMGGVIDMRRFSGLRKVLPITHGTFLCGAAALSGVPFITSGFWSKDDIFAGLLHASQHRGGVAGTIYAVLFVVGLVTAGLTAFYTFRGYFLTFWGEERVPEEAGHHAHESPPVMWVPLVVLAFGAITVGWLNAEPFTSGINQFLERTPHLASARPPEAEGLPIVMWLGSIAFAAAGIGGAWWLYVRQPELAPRIAREARGLYQASLSKFYIDELYEIFFIRPLAWFADLCRAFDTHIIDNLVDLVAQVPPLIGYLFRPVQNGLVQFYALFMVLGLAAFLIALVRSL